MANRLDDHAADVSCFTAVERRNRVKPLPQCRNAATGGSVTTLRAEV
jgi:hypothetical protein